MWLSWAERPPLAARRGHLARRWVMAKNYLKKIRNLPTLPAILARIMSTLDDPRSSAGDLERIIRNDQALTTKLLAVANSAYYGFRHEVNSVRRAVVAIGYQEVRNLCVGLSLMGYLKPGTFKDPDMAEKLWLHSLAVSEGARIVAEKNGTVDAELAFTSGLLHDVGKVVLSAFFPEDVAQLQALLRTGVPFLEAERELEMAHEDVGRALANHWELPPMIAEVMGRHHHLSRALDHIKMVSTVHVADYLARRLGLADTYRNDDPELKPLATESLGLSNADLVFIAKDLRLRQEAIVALWQRMLDPQGMGAMHEA